MIEPWRCQICGVSGKLEVMSNHDCLHSWAGIIAAHQNLSAGCDSTRGLIVYDRELIKPPED